MIFTQRITIPQGVLVREVAGEAVILNLNTETYFGLDEVGTCMWQALANSPTVQHAYDILISEYDVAPDILRNDLINLVEELTNHGLLELGAA